MAKKPEPKKEEEVKVEEKKKKEKKSQKERPKSKKKHTNVKVWKLYKKEGDKLIRTNQSCPRCGPGTFIASFKNRKYCGRCGWSEISKEKKAS
jgi:ubiquitin-small subunit ribosomal protein S27Ae